VLPWSLRPCGRRLPSARIRLECATEHSPSKRQSSAEALITPAEPQRLADPDHSDEDQRLDDGGSGSLRTERSATEHSLAAPYAARHAAPQVRLSAYLGWPKLAGPGVGNDGVGVPDARGRASVHLGLWGKQSARYAHLLLFVVTASIAACAAFELLMMRTATAQDYASARRWARVPLLTVFLAARNAVARGWFPGARPQGGVLCCIVVGSCATLQRR
jgi:hypothetical protein